MSARDRLGPFALRRHPLRAPAAAAALAVAISVATGPGVSATLASWNDSEYGAADLAAMNCATTSAFGTRGNGTFLDSDVLTLPNTVGVAPLTVTKSGTAAAVAQPTGATSLGSDASANPLTVTALNSAISVPLGGLLQVPTGTSTGALNEYAQAHSTGASAGASGLVSNSGAIAFSSSTPLAQLPTVATLDLRNVTSTVLGSTSASVLARAANLKLDLGAVASSATLDACANLWGASLAASLSRGYRIADLDMTMNSSLVGDLTSAVSTTVTSLKTTLDNLSSNVNAGLTTAITALLSSKLGGLSLGPVTNTLTASYDFSGVTALLTNSYTSADGVVTVNLGTGLVTVDLAKWLGGTDGLNGFEPNHQFLVDTAALAKLQSDVTSTLGTFVADVTTALNTAVARITIQGNVSVDLTAVIASATVSLARIAIGIPSPGLTLSVLTGTTQPAGITTSITALNGITCNPNGTGTGSTILCPVFSGIQNVVNTTLWTVVGTAVNGVVQPLVTGLITTLNNLAGITSGSTAPIYTLLRTVASGLFGQTGIASLVVNAENAPVPTGNPGPPADWGTLPTGQYDIAALHLGVLGLLGTSATVHLDLGRSSVGANTRLS